MLNETEEYVGTCMEICTWRLMCKNWQKSDINYDNLI